MTVLLLIAPAWWPGHWLCKFVRVKWRVVLHSLDVNSHVLRRTDTDGPNEVWNLHPPDIAIIIVIVLNRIVAESSRYDCRLTQEQTVVFIEVEPFGCIALRETDDQVC